MIIRPRRTTNNFQGRSSAFNNRILRLAGEVLERRFCLTAVFTFAARELALETEATPSYAQVFDMDADGDLDLAVAFEEIQSIQLFENVDGKGELSLRPDIAVDVDVFDDDILLESGDIDGDLVVDIATVSGGNVTWIRNPNRFGTAWKSVSIANSNELRLERSISIVDLDSDGDNDIAVTFRGFNTVWYENVDSRGTFGAEQPVLDIPPANSEFGDVDGDGDVDLITSSAFEEGNPLRLYLNIDGTGTFGEPVDIGELESVPNELVLEDIDDDSDLDLLVAGTTGISLFENDGGSFGEANVLSNNSANWVGVADIDGDGDLDVYSGNGSSVMWIENQTGLLEFGSPVSLISRNELNIGFIGPAFADIDGDGDGEFFLAGEPGRRKSLLWLERRGIGDVNRDGVFNSSDLVSIFQKGKFEDGIPRNATFDEGDWDGDFEFSTSDLVLAFQLALYEV